MELKAIEELVEKYLQAETTLQEEEQLQQYFCSGKVAPHLQEYVSMFGYFSMAKEDGYTGKPIFKPGRKKVYAWVAIAASFVLLAGIFTQQSQNLNEFGSYDDPEIAMQKTIEALEMVSTYMNAGTGDLKYLGEFEDTRNKLIKH